MISMGRLVFFLICATTACALLSPTASAKVVEHTFDVNDYRTLKTLWRAVLPRFNCRVGNLTITKMCQNQVITAVNGSLPGPTILVNEGDTLIVHVLNKSPYNLTLHWHGIFQLFNGWADGPEYVTQCPILPGNRFTYNFNITGQEGTLWWHAHTSYLRATVYGALIISPRAGRKYQFTKPAKEFPILLGEWWNANVYDVEEEALNFGGAPNISDAYTINGRLGDQFPCSANETHKIQVEKGKTYLLRIINAALNNQFFFSVANHNMTVVAIDASYTNPYVTDVVVTGPGQTTDVLLKANQPIGDYYMAAHPYISAAGIQFVANATVGIIQYKTNRSGNSSSTPIMPTLPAFNDTPTAHKFFSNLTGLKTAPFWVPVPREIDEKMFMTFGLGVSPCGANRNCSNSPFGTSLRFSSSMNNHSFELPSRTSMLEAHFNNVSGVYTEDFPNNPPLVFDYTSSNLSFGLAFTEKSTKVKRLKFNSTVEIVFQNTALIGIENHPIHLHGFNFHVLAQGFGNYNSTVDERKFNLDDPQERNTIGVPAGGWAVVRFRANNAGVWFMHCHLDVHMPWGLGTAFVVENGPTAATSLRPPPSDLPKC